MNEQDKAVALAGESGLYEKTFPEGLNAFYKAVRQQFIAELAQKSGVMPKLDTHCYDDDTNKDVWSHSQQSVREAIAAMQARVDQLEQALELAHDHMQLYLTHYKPGFSVYEKVSEPMKGASK